MPLRKQENKIKTPIGQQKEVGCNHRPVSQKAESSRDPSKSCGAAGGLALCPPNPRADFPLALSVEL